ncbi:hypothetical protein FRACA_60037 [Frankia canadensis]|uniref:Uncharacterized protein n=1 Tax=Frankia canadensis TaxID=1836972 RepID=A0A2I2KZG0_9ACTN|nr:hypothetical protein FRACA_60037 [Frankia canadensis]SOU58341.1 hypothetical protein FRACA_60037 [Frankia canadensis]
MSGAMSSSPATQASPPLDPGGRLAPAHHPRVVDIVSGQVGQGALPVVFALGPRMARRGPGGSGRCRRIRIGEPAPHGRRRRRGGDAAGCRVAGQLRAAPAGQRRPLTAGISHARALTPGNAGEAILPSGRLAGTPQEALDCACGLYLGDTTAWLNPPPPATPDELTGATTRGRVRRWR